jgi:hypothetical protein
MTPTEWKQRYADYLVENSDIPENDATGLAEDAYAGLTLSSENDIDDFNPEDQAEEDISAWELEHEEDNEE